MGMGQSLSDLPGYGRTTLGRKRTFFFENRRQRLAIHQIHNYVRRTIAQTAIIVNPYDIGVVQFSDDLSFELETLQAVGGAYQVRSQALHGYGFSEMPVPALIDL